MPWLDRRASEWTYADLEGLVALQDPEGSRLELKQDLPVHDTKHGWRVTGRIHRDEKNGIAKEVVALANTYGGTLIIGVEESSDEPKRAVKLATPIPEIDRLVAQLRPTLFDKIDPPIQGLEIEAIAAPSRDGSGYLVITTPSSAAKPHGFGEPPQVYIRRDDRSEPSSMRDIQAMFWEARTDRERVQELLKSYGKEFRTFPYQGDLVFQIAAVSSQPLAMVSLPRAVRSGAVLRDRSTSDFYPSTEAAEFPRNLQRWKPTATGAEYLSAISNDGFHRAALWQIDETGAVVVTASNNLDLFGSSEVPSFAPGWYVKTAGTLIGLTKIVSDWTNYGGGWVFAARFSGRPRLQVSAPKPHGRSAPIDLSTELSIRPITIGATLSPAEGDEVADRIWQAFGLFRPDGDKAFHEGFEETIQFGNAGRR